MIVSTTAIGVFALVWFVRQEGRSASPILPLFLFRNREFSAANVTSFIAGFGLFLPLAYFPRLPCRSLWPCPQPIPGSSWPR